MKDINIPQNNTTEPIIIPGEVMNKISDTLNDYLNELLNWIKSINTSSSYSNYITLSPKLLNKINSEFNDFLLEIIKFISFTNNNLQNNELLNLPLVNNIQSNDYIKIDDMKESIPLL